MKLIIIITFFLTCLLAPAQDILDGEREPIIVETKTDLQSELQLLPLDLIKDVTPDSLLKFNYSYHGKPIRSDFVLYPEQNLLSYLKLSTGTHNRFGVSNYLHFSDYHSHLSYLHREDKNERQATYFAWENYLQLPKKQNIIIATQLLKSEDPQVTNSKNETGNFGLKYTNQNFDYFYIQDFVLATSYEIRKNTDAVKKDYWNISAKITAEPITNYLTEFNLNNNHNQIHAQFSFYTKNNSSWGLWSGLSHNRILISPYLNFYLNHDNFTIKLANKPYCESKSLADLYQKHLYGNYLNSKSDFLIPGNAIFEISYFHYLTWSLGYDLRYAVDEPIYRNGSNGSHLYLDSYWQASNYLKASYQSQNLVLTAKGEIINYNNFDADFLPFKPKIRFTSASSYTFKNMTLILDYIIEHQAKDDYNNGLSTSHILNFNADYGWKNWLTLFFQADNLLNSNHNNYVDHNINQIEITAGVKLFF